MGREKMGFRYVAGGKPVVPAVVSVLEGIPAGLRLDAAAVDAVLARRQGGYGRGGRMRIERDRLEGLGGLRGGRTLGTPLLLVLRNRDDSLERLPPVTRPRPRHAHLAGMLKMQTRDAPGRLQ